MLRLQLFALTISFFACIATVTSGNNYIKIHDVSAQAGDTITIKVEIINEQAFVGFNFDIPLPPSMKYIEGSERLHRDDGHFLLLNEAGINVVRIISASMSNKAFAGNEGIVVTFEVQTSSQPANYKLSAVQAVIGNIEAKDILTSTIDGMILLE